ncbi:hypothetical protein [Kribbella speibonae]|uniref:Uncharacterized protein n=1 Tax=Kribbella speibonae TaxID=1572660 RepID=A0A4R0IRA1_9ACTN|nr:hypothetical protein [Kribbella speibonae]TCC36323.1 hypothetical protein E0H92_27105 [Kribbella speibonae]
MRDPVHDRPPKPFVDRLEQLATSYRSLRAALVLTVRSELWRGHPTSIPGVCFVRLDNAPDSEELVARHVKLHGGDLEAVVTSEKVARHLKGMTAVRAADAVERILHEWERLSRDARDETQRIDHIAEMLDSHLDDLDQLFAEPGSAVVEADGNDPVKMAPLSTEDRCMLIALACIGAVQLPELDDASKELMGHLQRRPSAKTDAEPRTEIVPFEAFGGAGLRGRLRRIGAANPQGDTVALKQPGFGDAAVRYVWDYYPDTRRPIATWLVGLAGKDPTAAQAVHQRLSELIRRRQDVDFLTNDLKELTGKNTGLLADVLYDATTDAHMRRRCERVLYDWAPSEKYQVVVADVSRRLLLDGTCFDIALRRLRRVADAAQSQDATTVVLSAFESAVDDPALRDRFLARVSGWFSEAPARPSSNLALRAVLRATVDGVPWLLSDDAEGVEVHAVLGEALNDPATYGAIVGLLDAVTGDDELYARVVVGLRTAAAEQGAVLALLDLARQFRDTSRFGTRDPLSDLTNGLTFGDLGMTTGAHAAR